MTSAVARVAARIAPEFATLKLDDESDLRWYANESEASYGGLRSNFGAQLERMNLTKPRRRRRRKPSTDDRIHCRDCDAVITDGPRCQSCGAIGVESADAQLRRCVVAVRTPLSWSGEDDMIDRLDHNRRRSRIERRFVLIGQRHTRTLVRAYTIELWSGDRAYVYTRFGRLSPLVVLIGGPDLVDDCRRVASATAPKGVVEHLEALEHTAEERLGVASFQYLEAKKQVPEPS